MGRMIVPQFWAEGRAQHRAPGRQITARRFGWSDESQADAQAKADLRAQEALKRLVAGEKLSKREPKIPYNGAEGVPIREEIVSRHGEAVITRNSYGAKCLNTPDVLFADVDFDETPSLRAYMAVAAPLVVAAIAAGWYRHSGLLIFVLIVVALMMTSPLLNLLRGALRGLRGGPEKAARSRIKRFVETHAGWNLRVYRTPSGLRLLATHQTFDPLSPIVTEFFQSIGVDRLYAQMCRNQHCFRARLTAKPWRIGISDHMKPRPGVWPVRPERLAERKAWLERYDSSARSFAACSLVETIGSGVIHPDVKAVQTLHDEMAQATSGLPAA